MELKYLEAMEEHKLKISDLPEDAQIGIQNVNDVLKGIKMLEARGKAVSEKTLKKLKAMDKWVYYEILDVVHDKDENEDEMPHDSDEVLDEAEKSAKSKQGGNDDTDDSGEDVATGIKIEAELKALYDSGKTSVTLDELRNTCKSTYDVIFKTYDDSGDNGIVTTHYQILETEEEVFTITKK